MNLNELAVLGLINEEPVHAYLLIEKMKVRGYENWAGLSVASVYRILIQMEKKGLVKSNLLNEGQGPAKKVFQLTPKGRISLRETVEYQLRWGGAGGPGFELGLAYLPVLEAGLALNAVEERKARLESGKKVMMTAWETQKPLPWHVEALFEHSKGKLQAELDFLGQLILRLKKEKTRNEKKGGKNGKHKSGKSL